MDRIGKYELLGKIGSGGFAVVYKGFDPFIKRPVAIKVCYSRDPETRERFHREAEIAGLLVHRNITTVYDFGLHGETPYLVEEYLPGEDLAHMIRRHEPGTVEEKLDVLIQIASGLGYAHSKGVLHRDVKPSNVRVLENGRVKIMDFGTAKLVHVDSDLTRTGMTLGTVAYLAPERLRGQRCGVSSDIFSLGVLAYELLSFIRPFNGRNIPELIEQVLSSPPAPLAEVWPGCPPSLAESVHRCLEKAAAERYGSCELLKADLERIRTETSPAVPAAAGNDARADVPQLDLQLSGLLERARQLCERGRYERAEVLLDEVLEIDPRNRDARQLLAACAARASTREDPAERRQRQINEAVASIRSYIGNRRMIQAAEALRFATDFLGDFDQAAELRRQLAKALEQDVRDLKGAGLRQARELVAQMESLREQNLLPLELAETFVEWVGDLDPDDLAARHLVSRIRLDARRREHARKSEISDRKRMEAVASIEKLLADGNPAMAERALKFAVRLFGEFEQISRLKHRIAEALRQQS